MTGNYWQHVAVRNINMGIEVRSVITFVLQYDYKHGITSNDSYCVVIEQKRYSV